MSPVLTDLALAPLAGYVGTKMMEPISSKLYELESEQDRQREDAARPGAPYMIATQKTTDLLGLRLSAKQMERLSLVLHYGLAIQWAPLYAVPRRRTSLSPPVAGLATGAAMSLVADEMMTPALGFSESNRAYPLSTHVRRLSRAPRVRPESGGRYGGRMAATQATTVGLRCSHATEGSRSRGLGRWPRSTAASGRTTTSREEHVKCSLRSSALAGWV